MVPEGGDSGPDPTKTGCRGQVDGPDRQEPTPVPLHPTGDRSSLKFSRATGKVRETKNRGLGDGPKEGKRVRGVSVHRTGVVECPHSPSVLVVVYGHPSTLRESRVRGEDPFLSRGPSTGLARTPGVGACPPELSLENTPLTGDSRLGVPVELKSRLPPTRPIPRSDPHPPSGVVRYGLSTGPDRKVLLLGQGTR